MNVADIALTSLETITCFDITTGNYLFTLDELQSANISQSEEKVDIVGRQGRKLNSLKRNKAVTVSGENGLVSGGLWELQTGSSFANKVTNVVWADYLTVASGAATTSYIAVGTEGAEIENLYIKNADGTLGAKLEQAASASAGKFTYNPATKGLAFHTDVADGTEIVVYYKRAIQAAVLDNKSDVYSGKCAMYIDAIGEDICANIFRVQIYIPKADFSGEFSFDMGDNQTIHSFSADALAGSCGGAGQFFTYTIFGSNAADYTEEETGG